VDEALDGVEVTSDEGKVEILNKFLPENL